jgi:UDP-N-acetylglucosamine 4-epimerase
VENAVQANLLAATTSADNRNEVYNVAVSDITSLNELVGILKSTLRKKGIPYEKEIAYRAFRDGDVRHSQADISKSLQRLGYAPEYRISEGIETAMQWYMGQSQK